jgi:hypothetical protein
MGKPIAENLGDIPTGQGPAQANVGEQDIELLVWAIDETNRILTAPRLHNCAAISMR